MRASCVVACLVWIVTGVLLSSLGWLSWMSWLDGSEQPASTVQTARDPTLEISIQPSGDGSLLCCFFVLLASREGFEVLWEAQLYVYLQFLLKKTTKTLPSNNSRWHEKTMDLLGTIKKTNVVGYPKTLIFLVFLGKPFVFSCHRLLFDEEVVEWY